MAQALDNKLPEIHVGRPQTVGPLTVFPLWTGAPAPNGLVTGLGVELNISEVTPQPQVGNLVITNLSEVSVLVLEGELLVGGWQHRVLAHDVVVPPRPKFPPDWVYESSFLA